MLSANRVLGNSMTADKSSLWDSTINGLRLAHVNGVVFKIEIDVDPMVKGRNPTFAHGTVPHDVPVQILESMRKNGALFCQMRPMTVLFHHAHSEDRLG